MPMLYGEGHRAFQRLQEEIIRAATTVDHSILAWVPAPTVDHSIIPWEPAPTKTEDEAPFYDSPQLLAPSPKAFNDGYRIVSWNLPQMQMLELSSTGLTLSCDLDKLAPKSHVNEGPSLHSIALNCRYENEPLTRIALGIVERRSIEDFEVREPHGQHHIKTYDRDLGYERAQRNLMSLHTREIHNSMWMNTSLTLRRYPLLFPDRVYNVRVEGSDCQFGGNEQSCGYGNQMLPVYSHNREGEYSSWLKIELPGAKSTDKIEVDVRIAIIPDRSRIRPPLLFVHTNGGSWEHCTPFNTGEPQNLSIAGVTDMELRVSARFVNFDGELLWNIVFEPSISLAEISRRARRNRFR